MAVLCEAISVIVPTSFLEQRYDEGVAGYAEEVPNATFCSDGVLTRVGFMSPLDVEAWVDHLIRNGFEFLDESEEWFVDVAIVDQIHGLTAGCTWLVTEELAGVRWVWSASEEPGELIAPEGWVPENSRSMTLITTNDAGQVQMVGPGGEPAGPLPDPDAGEVGFVGRPPIEPTG
jgi:hypothetical protein